MQYKEAVLSSRLTGLAQVKRRYHKSMPLLSNYVQNNSAQRFEISHILIRIPKGNAG